MSSWIKSAISIALATLITVGVVNINGIAAAIVPGVNERISLRPNGLLPSGSSSWNYIAPNGKMLVYTSSAINILPSGGRGVFIYNFTTGTTNRVNVSTAGVVDNGGSTTYSEGISATGRYVIVNSQASNFIDGTTIPTTHRQLYLRDTVTSTTTLITQSSDGAISNGSSSEGMGVSSDGRFVLFGSNATTLHPDSTDGKKRLYMLDRTDNSLTLIDRRTDGTVATNNYWGVDASMSCDGSIIAFSNEDNLIVGDTPTGRVDLYLLDRRGATDKLTNLTRNANYFAASASVSCNGDYVGFESKATNLDQTVSVPVVNNRPYVYDRVNNSYHFVAMTSSNAVMTQAVCGTTNGSPCVRISDTGVATFVANTTLLTGHSGSQVYIRDIHSGTTELVSKNSSGVESDGSGMYDPTITADSAKITYSSNATNLLPGSNGHSHVFTSLTGY